MDKGKKCGSSASVIKIEDINREKISKMVNNLRNRNPNSRSHLGINLNMEEQILWSENLTNEADVEVTYINISESLSPRDSGLKIEEYMVERLVEQFSNLQTIDENSGLEIQNKNACPSLIELKSCTACLSFDRSCHQDLKSSIPEKIVHKPFNPTIPEISSHEILIPKPELSFYEIAKPEFSKFSTHEILKATKSELTCYNASKGTILEPCSHEVSKLSSSEFQLPVKDILKRYEFSDRTSNMADELMDLTNSYGSDYTITIRDDAVSEKDSQGSKHQLDFFRMSEIIRYLEFKDRMEGRKDRTKGSSRYLQDFKVSSRQNSKIKKNNFSFKKLIVKESEGQGMGNRYRLSVLYQTGKRFRHVASPVGLYIKNEVLSSVPPRRDKQKGQNVCSRRPFLDKSTSTEKFKNAKTISLPQLTYEGSKYKVIGFETSAELPGPRDALFKIKPEVLVHCYHKNTNMDSIPF